MTRWKWTPVVFLIVFSLTVRFFYAEFETPPPIGADTIGYYQLGEEMLKNPDVTILVNRYRTPAYPLFLAGLVRLCGSYTNNGLEDLYEATECIVRVQTVLGVICVLIFYTILLRIGVNRTLSVIVSMLYSADIFVFGWEQIIRTETISFVYILLTVYFSILALQKLKSKYLFWIFVWGSFAWLTRPSQILIPILAYGFIWVKHFHRDTIGKSLKNTGILLFFLIWYLSLPLAYIYINAQEGYTGISQVSDIDILGRILEFNLPIEAGKTSPYYLAIRAYRQNNGTPQPFRFIDSYDPLIYGDAAKMTQLKEFNTAVIRANLPEYITKAFMYIPNTFHDIHFETKVHPEVGDRLSFVFSYIEGFYLVVWQIFGYTTLILTLYIVVRYLKHPTQQSAMLALLGSIYLSHILLTVLVVYDVEQEYARLVATMRPVVYIFITVSLIEWNRYTHMFKKRV